MTNLKSLSLLFFLLALLTATSTPATHSRILKPNDEKLIENTCQKTPNYNLCLQSLKADPRSSGADVTGLAQIMVKAMTAKANAAINKIHQLLRGRIEPKQKETLIYCARLYKTIVEADVPQAIEALQKGDPKFAEDGANDAANEATYCERSFSARKSPITQQNNGMHEVAAVTAAIVRLLL